MNILLLFLGIIIAIFLLSVLMGAPYVPTHRRHVDEVFLSLRKVSSKDTIVDIGSGDGVVMLSALRAGVGRAVGYEINPFLVLISWLRTVSYGKKSSVSLKNFWQVSFPDDTTVVYTFGESRDIYKMYQKVQKEATRLNKNIDFISYAFEVPNKQYYKRNKTHLVYKIKPLQSV